MATTVALQIARKGSRGCLVRTLQAAKLRKTSYCRCQWMSTNATVRRQIPATNIAIAETRQSMRDRIFSSLATAPSSSTTSTASTSSLDDLLQAAGVDSDHLHSLAQMRPTPLRLADMYKYGSGTDLDQRLRNAQFLYKELQIRLAQRAVDLLTLPHGLSEATPIRQVASIYLGYFQRFRDLEMPRTYEEEEVFTDFLQSLVLDRAAIPMSIARGVLTWRAGEHSEGLDLKRMQEMEDTLYRFFTARVGMRFLAVHHVLSCRRESTQALRNVVSMLPRDENDTMLGCIQKNCDVVKEVRRVADLVTEQTEGYYGMCPKIDVVDSLHGGEPRDFTYVVHHLHHMVGELLKNSCRATVRLHLDHEIHGLKEELPPIRVVIVKGEEDVTIKVADKGGGIPRSLMAKIWKFAHSTADEDESKTDFGTDLSGARIRGFGLPLARIYARYFGGELTLKSMEGYGLDAYLHLPRLGDSCENLPRRVRSSPGELDSIPRSIRKYSTVAASRQNGKLSRTRRK